MKIYDLLGKEVATLIDEELPMGQRKVNWNVQNFASGVYIYKMQAGDPSTGFPNKSGQAGQDFVQARKMILMR